MDDVKISGAIRGHTRGAEKPSGPSVTDAGLETKVEALQEAVQGIKATLDKLVSGQAELTRKLSKS